MLHTKHLAVATAALLVSTALVAPRAAMAQETLPEGQTITPLAVPGATQQFLNPGLAAYPNFIAGQAVREELSPDGTTLAVICAGQNSLDDVNGNLDVPNSSQYIFIYDVTGANKTSPALKQVLKQTNAYVGLVWSPDSSKLFATGGADDAVYVYTQTAGVFALTATVALNHSNTGLGGFVRPNAGGLAVSTDGGTLVVANNYNDSISVIDIASMTVRYEHDLRPYFANNEGTSGVAGGEYPFAVVLKNGIAYVSSARDREVVAVNVSSSVAGKLVKRIPLNGNALGMALDATGSNLYVAQDNADQVAVINTSTNTVATNIDTRAPVGKLLATAQHGAAPFSVRIAHGVGRFPGNVYVTNAQANSIAVINPTQQRLVGLIPTAYEPTDVAFSADGTEMYIINGKSNTGPNPGHLNSNTALMTSFPGGSAAATAAAAAARATNQYQFQLERASLVSAPVPNQLTLNGLTAKVLANNGYIAKPLQSDVSTMAILRQNIQHVIYIVKENRTFDQILGDLTNGANVDPTINQFPAAITPNYHALATSFVTLDNFNDPGDGSMDGWSWSMQGRITNTQALTQQINYAFVNRGLSYESEGSNRNIPVGLGTADRDGATGGLFSAISAGLPGGTANLLPGGNNHTIADTPIGFQKGYIFDAALAANKTVRNYGWLENNLPTITDGSGNPLVNPGTSGIQQVAVLNPDLVGLTDLYFRAFDQNVPDLYRFNEWHREFNQYVAGGNLPNLELVRMAHDHMGSFGTAQSGINTPELQQADNDYAVALMIQTVANSPYANNTLFVIIEDDCQDGPDHVDSHRATMYMVGPYVKKGGVVVSTHYSQVNALRTIEDILGTQHLNLNTATARPMSDVFDTAATNRNWSFTASASTYLPSAFLSQVTQLEGQKVHYAQGPAGHPTHDAAWWAKKTEGFDFSDGDRINFGAYNRVLWEGLKTGKAYPQVHAAADTAHKAD